MIRPASAARYALRLRRLVDGAETRLLQFVAKLTLAALQAADLLPALLLHQQVLRRLAERLLARLRPQVLDQVIQAVDDAWDQGTAAADAEALRLRERGAGLTDPAEADRRGQVKAQVIGQRRRQLVEELMWRVDRAFQEAPAGASRAWRQTAEQAASFRLPTATALPQVEGEITAGLADGATRRQAAQRALDRLADDGITGFVDQRGRRWELASYVETATRTVTQRTLLNAALDRLGDHGIDLVYVPDVPGECVACRPWEHRVLSISGASPGHPSLAEAVAAGWGHPGCRHGLVAWLPGVSSIPDTLAADPEGDKARQRTRALERQVRFWKRRELVAITEVAKAKAARHRKDAQARLRAHVLQTSPNSLRYSQSRTQIGGAR